MSTLKTSSGIFLLSFMYFSILSKASLIIAFISVSSSTVKMQSLSKTSVYPPTSINSSIFALLIPSTRTLIVPSGNFNNCRIVAKVPTLWRSSLFGSSIDSSFCVTKKIFLSASIACVIALTEDFLPINKGITVCGNTTTSRSGNKGTVWMIKSFEFVDSSVPIITKHLAYLIISLDSA